MKIVFTRDKQGGDNHSVRLERDDGTSTWTRMTPFFVEHDLTHFAVETVLGLKDAFWGLMGQGWEIASFEERQADSRKVVTLPAEAYLAEGLVGVVQIDYSSGPLDWDGFTAMMRDYYSTWNVEPPSFTEAQLEVIRAMRDDLFGQWRSLPPGESMELDF